MRRSIALAAVALALLAAPAGAGWRQPGFAIGGYIGGGEPGALRLLNDAGIRLLVSSDHSEERAARQLATRIDSLRRADPSFLLRDLVYYEHAGAANALSRNPDPDVHRDAVVSELASLNNPAVAGWYVWDEPPIGNRSWNRSPAQIFDAIHAMTLLARRHPAASGKLVLNNMLQISGGAHALISPFCGPDTLEAYRCYLEQYLGRFDADSLPAPVLMFDAYPFEVPWAYWYWYFANLAVIRDKALEHSRAGYSIPFWSVVQAAPRCASDLSTCQPTPTFAQIRWQVFSSLAYGAKGIFYWTLRPAPTQPPDPGWGRSFLNLDGTANAALYPQLSRLNHELLRLGPTLMRLSPVRVRHARALGYKGIDGEIASRGMAGLVYGLSGSDSVLTGEFVDRGKGARYVMVVNQGSAAPAPTLHVDFPRTASAVYRVDKRTGREVRVARRVRRLDVSALQAGDGELFHVVLAR